LSLSDRDLARRMEQAALALRDCHLCGNHCGLDRTRHAGPCGIADVVHVAGHGPHHGEEDPLRGRRGSGTIFFSGCNLHCIYCQNADISQTVVGRPVTSAELAEMMLALQAQGCHNVNWVSPTHVAAHLVPALVLALQAGLRIPIVYNTGGYDAPQALALMDGLVDIYMPDMKYADPEAGRRLSGVRDYPAVNRAAVREMHRQVGDLALDADGIATQGLLVRHLVLPDGLAGTAEIARFLAEEISTATYINVMGQYRPAYRAAMEPSLRRRVTASEVAEAVRETRAAGLHRFD
jgi:putative pyruvate formate lyase activating enzyme